MLMEKIVDQFLNVQHVRLSLQTKILLKILHVALSPPIRNFTNSLVKVKSKLCNPRRIIDLNIIKSNHDHGLLLHICPKWLLRHNILCAPDGHDALLLRVLRVGGAGGAGQRDAGPEGGALGWPGPPAPDLPDSVSGGWGHHGMSSFTVISPRRRAVIPLGPLLKFNFDISTLWA